MLTMTFLFIIASIVSILAAMYFENHPVSIESASGKAATNKFYNAKVLSISRDEHEDLAYLNSIDWHIDTDSAEIAKRRLTGAIKLDRQDFKEDLPTEKNIQRQIGREPLPVMMPVPAEKTEAVFVARLKRAISFTRDIVLNTIKVILKVIHMKGDSTDGDDSQV